MVRDVIKRFGRCSGLEIGHYRPFGARRAKQLDMQRIASVLDVGANLGQYARELRAFGYGGSILSFEPISSVYSQLATAAARDPSWDCFNVALGDADRHDVINIATKHGSSSLLPMLAEHRAAAPHIYYHATEPVEICRLDSLNLALQFPAWLKLDVQGYEDRVLEGAQEILEHVQGIEAELSLAALYDGQASLQDVVDRLDSSGFRLVDLEPSFRNGTDGRVLAIDALFVRGPRDANDLGHADS